jgi:hypothetical protein
LPQEPLRIARRLEPGEAVGQRDLAVTANTYTHVLVDERELDYPALLAEGDLMPLS